MSSAQCPVYRLQCTLVQCTVPSGICPVPGHLSVGSRLFQTSPVSGLSSYATTPNGSFEFASMHIMYIIINCGCRLYLKESVTEDNKSRHLIWSFVELPLNAQRHPSSVSRNNPQQSQMSKLSQNQLGANWEKHKKKMLTQN